jgi:pimeloyl-ACP methyl ester carboxylesterase
LIITIQNKSVHASDAGQGIENSKDTIVFLHGSGLSHIVWSLTEQFFSNKNLMFYQLIYLGMEILKVRV